MASAEPETAPGVTGDVLGAEDRVEVTAFLERKTWIQDKIKVRTTLTLKDDTSNIMQFLENMPPIDVFYGVEHILPTNSGEPVQGLPTRQEVAAWVAEHDAIEAETEQFDKGDMLRLKQMAKSRWM